MNIPSYGDIQRFDACQKEYSRSLELEKELQAMSDIAIQKGLELHEQLASESLICDFCSDSDPICLYVTQAGSVLVDIEAVSNSGSPRSMLVDDDGKWAACVICDQMIAYNRWDDLLNRSLDAYIQIHGQGVFQFRKQIAQIIRAQWTDLLAATPTRQEIPVQYTTPPSCEFCDSTEDVLSINVSMPQQFTGTLALCKQCRIKSGRE